jgi:DNA-binding NtrC family response regulator
LTFPLATMFFLFVMLLQSNGNIFWASLRMKVVMSVLRLKNINTLDVILGNIEKIRITEALRATNGMQRNAAKLLNVPPSTLNKKIAKYKIAAESYQGVSVVEAIRLRRLAS